jgi:hypothetical protein
MIAQPIKKSSTFKETESSLPCSLASDSGSYPKPVQSSLHSHTLFLYKLFEFIGFEVLAALPIKSSIFSDITLYGPLKFSRRLRETNRFHSSIFMVEE